MNWLNYIIAYSQDKPLLFTHLFFWGFFVAVLAGYSLVYKSDKRRTVYLLLVSLFFYFKTSGIFLVLLVFTIVSDYFWGKRIYNARSRGVARLCLTMSIVLNLALLAYFKYAYFFHESFQQITGGEAPFLTVLLGSRTTFSEQHFQWINYCYPWACRSLHFNHCRTQ